MIEVNVSGRDGRILLIGGSIVGALIGFSKGLPAWRTWERSAIADATATASEIAAVHNGAQQLPTLRDSLASRRRLMTTLESSLLSGASAASAAAILSRTVQRIAAECRVKVSALQLQGDSVSGDTFARVRVRVSGLSDVAALAAFLRRIEGAKTRLVVRELTVARPDPAGSDAKPETLRIDVLVEGIAMIRRDLTT
jgi:hypothetical protein